MRARLVVLLTDFGTADIYVGVMKGVILSIAPSARLMDLTHEIRRHDVREGAFQLAAAAPYFPQETIFLGVVDPGVGSARKGLIARAGPWTLVGPDNGLFSFFWSRHPDAQVYELAAAEYRRPTVSATFHGRDIFAPAAAWAARGVRPERFGPPIATPVRLELPEPVEANDHVDGFVIHVDRFGNLVTNFEMAWLDARRIRIGSGWRLRLGAHEVRRQVATYAEAAPNEPVALAGSAGYLEVALRENSAAELLDAGVGTPVRLVRAV